MYVFSVSWYLWQFTCEMFTQTVNLIHSLIFAAYCALHFCHVSVCFYVSCLSVNTVLSVCLLCTDLVVIHQMAPPEHTSDKQAYAHKQPKIFWKKSWGLGTWPSRWPRRRSSQRSSRCTLFTYFCHVNNEKHEKIHWAQTVFDLVRSFLILSYEKLQLYNFKSKSDQPTTSDDMRNKIKSKSLTTNLSIMMTLFHTSFVVSCFD